MIIGIDIRDLRLAATGQKTTLEELCRQLKRQADLSPHTFHFFDTFLPVYTGRNKLLLIMEHARQQLWKQIGLPLKAWSKKCDVLYCNDYFVPYIHLGFQTVQIFHDAFFFEFPQYYNKIWLRIFRHIALPAARRCAFIVTPTEYSRQRVHQFTHIPLHKIIAIHQGPKSLSVTAGAIPSWLPVNHGYQYILHVGVMEKRKNLPRLILAYRQLLEKGYAQYKLVLAGKGSGKMHSDDIDNIRELIRQHHLENHVLLTGYLDDASLAAVYQHAALYVFPSYNEGFGIPILEAFRFGLPVLVANNTCLPEVGGDAVLTFDPFNVSDIFSKMEQVLSNPNTRKLLAEKGKLRLQQFSWQKTTAELIHVFEKAAST